MFASQHPLASCQHLLAIQWAVAKVPCTRDVCLFAHFILNQLFSLLRISVQTDTHTHTHSHTHTRPYRHTQTHFFSKRSLYWHFLRSSCFNRIFLKVLTTLCMILNSNTMSQSRCQDTRLGGGGGGHFFLVGGGGCGWLQINAQNPLFG